jgi:hypothetical protein
MMSAKCSTFCFCPDNGGVEVLASYLQSSTASTMVLVPLGVSMSPSLEHIIALKPDAATPTTCSTEVLASDINSMSAKLIHPTAQVSMRWTSMAVATLPATTRSGTQVAEIILVPEMTSSFNNDTSS